MDKRERISNQKHEEESKLTLGQVQDPLFQSHPDFFDARDMVQVKYEMLRAHHVQGESVTEVARRFGFSRQTFYSTSAAFIQERWQGLLPDKSGPKGPNKITQECAEFLQAQYLSQSGTSWHELAQAAAHHFGIFVHPRTIQRLLDKKKLPPSDSE